MAALTATALLHVKFAESSLANNRGKHSPDRFRFTVKVGGNLRDRGTGMRTKVGLKLLQNHDLSVMQGMGWIVNQGLNQDLNQNLNALLIR